MLIRPRVDLPHVLKRALEAYRAGDAVDVGEAFSPEARLSMRIDRQLARRLGLLPGQELREARGALEVMSLYSAELHTFDVTHLDVVSTLQAGRDVAAVCEWSIRQRGTANEFIGQCHNIWTLDRLGRKIVGAHSVCRILTPDSTFN